MNKKYSNLDRALEAANHSKNSVMEAENHVKYRASSKSLMSRGNFLRKICIASLAAGIIFFGCDKDNKKGSFTRMNIENAKSLFIASSGSGSKMYGVKKSSLKSTSEDEIYEISYLDENGEQIEKNNPCHIFDAGDYAIVCFGDIDYFYEAYFVKKSDGLVYAIPQDYMPHLVGNKYYWDDRFVNVKDKIQMDINKNFYYSTWQSSSPHKKTLYKISSIASSAIQFSEVSAVNDDIDAFCVDRQGNILYPGGSAGFRYRKTDGSFVNMSPGHPEIEGQLQWIWKGTDGGMYGIFATPLSAYLVRIQNGEIAGLLKEVSYLFNRGHVNLSGGYGPGGSALNYLFNIQGRIIHCSDAYHEVPPHLIDISSEALYKEIPTSVLGNTVFNNQLYHFDDKTFSCTHINIDTGETSLLFDLDESKLGNFDIDKILNISESGVEFSAVQLSNGNYVVGKIGLDNVVTIQQEISGTVTVILPLNL